MGHVLSNRTASVQVSLRGIILSGATVFVAESKDADEAISNIAMRLLRCARNDSQFMLRWKVRNGRFGSIE